MSALTEFGLPADLVNFIKNELYINKEVTAEQAFERAKSFEQFKHYDFCIIDISDLFYHLPNY